MLENCFSFFLFDLMELFFVHVLRENGRKFIIRDGKCFLITNQSFLGFKIFLIFFRLIKYLNLNFPEFSYFLIIKKKFPRKFPKISLFRKLFFVVCENFCFGWQIWLLERVENNSFGRSANFLTNKYVFYVFGMWSDWNYDKFMKLNFDGKINEFWLKVWGGIFFWVTQKKSRKFLCQFYNEKIFNKKKIKNHFLELPTACKKSNK